MRYIQFFLSLVLLVGVAIVLSGCFQQDNQSYSVELEMWGVFDDSDAYGQIINDYRQTNPFVATIDYRKFLVDDYKADLLDALAAGNGPDIFLIHNTWLSEFQDKIEPAPAELINESLFRTNFVDVAAQDFLREGEVYGVPLSVDSLALYYNKDLFNFEGITSPPKTWGEFNDVARRLTNINDRGEIVQSGAAMGTAYNINRSTDILNMLFLQNNAEIITPQNRMDLGTEGENALEYYTQFANSGSSLYSWNPRQHYSLDAFPEGTLGMMLNYSWHYDTIQKKNSKLNFAVAELPQLSTSGQKVNYANYWAFVVSKNKIDETSPDPALRNQVRKHEAWEFLKFLTVRNGSSMVFYNGITGNSQEIALPIDAAQVYIEKTNKPAARRDLLENQKSDPVLGPFAFGNLIAKSWRQPNPEAVETIVAEQINAVNVGQVTVREAIELMEQRIQTYIRR